MMRTINWGIIGCGDVTEVKSGPAFNKVPGSLLKAVMRRDAAKAADYAKRHNVPKWYDDADALINDPDIDAVYVATPPSSHEQYAIAAMEAGKPVYLEKPMTLNAAAAKRIVQKSESLGVKLCVAHYRRQLPLFKKIKQLLDKQHLGDVRFVNIELFQPVNAKGFEPRSGYWRLDPSVSGGGLFHDLSPHQLDLMLYFFGKPMAICGVSLNQAHLYAADDMVVGTIQFDNAVVMNGAWNFNSPVDAARDRCTIVGSSGVMEFSIFTMQQLSVLKNGTRDVITFDPVPHVQQPMIEKVIAHFLGEGPNPCPGKDGVTVMEMIDKLTNSA